MDRVFASEDLKYVWNANILESMKEQALDEGWFTNLIQGCFLQASISIDEEKLEVYTIFRRRWILGGTRFNARGIDEDGNCANFIESEQVVIKKT
jgi:hypothetical protein